MDLMFTFFGRTAGMFTEVAAGDFDGVEERMPIHVNTMRKLTPNEQLIFCVQNKSGEALQTFLGVRTLVIQQIYLQRGRRRDHVGFRLRDPDRPASSHFLLLPGV